jgi:hypothetical protein
MRSRQRDDTTIIMSVRQYTLTPGSSRPARVRTVSAGSSRTRGCLLMGGGIFVMGKFRLPGSDAERRGVKAAPNAG